MARGRGARTQVAGAFETTYGTAPGSGYRRLPYISGFPSTVRGLLENDVLGFGRDPLAPDPDAPVTEGDLVVPMDVNSLGFWLKGLLGAATPTEDDGVYTHVFESGAWALPSMALELGMPDVPHYEMASGVKVNSLAFDTARTGRPQITLGLIGQGSVKAGVTAAGSPTSWDYKRFGNRHGSITRGGVDLASVVSAALTYSNNLDRVDTIRDDGLIDGLDESIASLTLSMTMRFANATMLDDALSGAPAAFALSFEISASEKVTFSVPRLFLPVPARRVDGPNGIQVTFEGVAAQQTDGGEMLQVTLVNSVASY